MQIRESGIPYRLAGRHTLAMAQEQLDHLPEEADKFIKMCYESRRVQIESEPPPTGERYLPTEEETKNSLRKLAAEFDDLPENP
jgi:hypothetical protein